MTTQQLTIGTTDLNKPGFSTVRDLLTLLDVEVRGNDIEIPGIQGVIPKARRIARMDTFLELMIFGFKDSAGSAHADPRRGLFENINYLNNTIMVPASGDGTRAATLTIGASTWTADVTLLPPLNARSVTNYMARGVLRLSIPEGRFV